MSEPAKKPLRMDHVLTRLWGIMEQHMRVRLFFLLGAMLVTALLEIAVLSMIQGYMSFISSGTMPFQDRIGWLAGDLDLRGQVLLLSGLVLAAILLKLSASVGTFFLMARTVANQRARLANQLFRSYQFAPFLWHAERNTATLQRNLLQDVPNISMSLTLQFLQLAMHGVMFVAILGFVLFMLPLPLMIAVSALAGLTLFVGSLAQKILSKVGSIARISAGDSLKVTSEGMRSLPETRVLGRRDFFIRRFSRIQSDLAWAMRRRIFIMQTMPLVLETLMMAALIGIIGFMAVLAVNTESVLGTAAVLLVAVFRMRQSLNRIVIAANTISSTAPSLPPVADDLATLQPFLAQPSKAGDTVGPGFAKLRFENVTFAFPGQTQAAVSGLTTELHRGEHLAVMGATGAGKSTFLALLLGLIRPESGSLTIDGRDMADVLGRWNAQIGYVPQSVFLTDDTIAANVAFGIPEQGRDAQRIREALRLAEVLDVVEALPKGLDTPIGEAGDTLSGGQRQRLGIARALYHEPSVIVLDEASSALDRKTQKRVMDTIATLPQNPTVISVTHQLEPLDYADRLIMLDKGRIVADGPVDEVRRSETFRQLIQSAPTEGAA